MLQTMERRAGLWLTANTFTVTRVALGVIFLWFGLLKFCPGLCDVEVMAQKTMMLMTFGLIPASACIRFLAIWECSMGLVLLLAPRDTRWGRVALQVCVASLLLHLAGTFLPLVLFPAETWKHLPYAPTLAGQYIAKNLVLLAAALSVGAAVMAPAADVEAAPQKSEVLQRRSEVLQQRSEVLQQRSDVLQQRSDVLHLVRRRA